MGIKHFYTWFKDAFPTSLIAGPVHIDHLFIDMNGIIHESAQFVYRYGTYEHTRRLGGAVRGVTCEHLYAEIKKRVNAIIKCVNPAKSVNLAIDGVAPKSKQNQQRQRRFISSMSPNRKFNTNQITPGTEFMMKLSANLSDLSWVRYNSVVTLQTDDVPGEGEHKLINRIRKSKDVDDAFCIVGLDADLIMLALLLPKRRVYVRRSCQLIDIQAAREQFPISMEDFLVVSCLVGNDFLPGIPSLEIKSGAFEELFKHLTLKTSLVAPDGKLRIRELIHLLSMVDEDRLLMEKLNDDTRFPDRLWRGSLTTYKRDYNSIKLRGNVCGAVYTYLKTIQWIIYYYTRGIPSWNWYYPYSYAPFLADIVNYAPTTPFKYELGQPSTKVDQLLRIIPPSDSLLLPENVREYHSGLSRACELDRDGKRYEWEAVVIVDFV